MDIQKHRIKIEMLANLVGAAVYMRFAYVLLIDLIQTHRLSSIFPLVLTSCFAYFFLTRDLPKETNVSTYDWLIAMGGTFLPFCFSPAPQVSDRIYLLLIQLIGSSISICGIISLNRSIGLVASNRGVKTFWAYKLVRHPIYAGYFITMVFFCVQNAIPTNFLILFPWATCEVLRIFAEEKELSKDATYRDYMQKTRWRLIPGIF